MTYSGQSPILGQGQASAAQIDAWMAVMGQQLAPKYAPDATYQPPPPIGLSIIGLCAGVGVNSDLAAAQICKESAGWQSAIVRDKNNPSGLGAENDNPYDKAATFATPHDGIRATIAHLLTYVEGSVNPWKQFDPRYDVTIKNKPLAGHVNQLSQLDGNWAVPGVGYGQGIANLANQLLATEGTPTVPTRAYHVAISYGHHNTDGGDATEQQQTPKLGKAVAVACRALGMEVRIVQDEVGLNPPMGLQDIAQRVVDWDNGGWLVDLYLETHTEAGPRGAFAIYPDTGSDVDNDAKRVGQDAAKRIAAAAGIPLRGDGTMSERATGVGAQGYRLGIFLRTVPIKAHCTRMIIEYGSHTDATDLAAINSHIAEVGVATALAFAAEAKRLGFPVKDAPDATPQSTDDKRIDPVTGFELIGGIRAYVEDLEAHVGPEKALMLIGHAKSEEYATDYGKAQDFQRMRLEWHPGARPQDWDILPGLVNDELIAAKAELAKLKAAAS